MTATQNEEWGEVFARQRERAESRAAARARVDAMLAAGDARAGVALDDAIARGDRERILGLLRQRREAR